MVPPGPFPPEPPSVALRHKWGTRLLLGLTLMAAVLGGATGLVWVAIGNGPEETLGVNHNVELVPQRLAILAICGVVNVGGAFGAWSFRRWGVYSVLCSSLIACAVNLKLGGTSVALPGLVGVALFFVLAGAIWVEFD